jgi:hypothetical protein
MRVVIYEFGQTITAKEHIAMYNLDEEFFWKLYPEPPKQKQCICNTSTGMPEVDILTWTVRAAIVDYKNDSFRVVIKCQDKQAKE